MFHPQFSDHIVYPNKNDGLFYKLGEKADAYLSWSGRKWTWLNDKKSWHQESQYSQISIRLILAITTLGILPLIALAAKKVYQTVTLNYCDKDYYGDLTTRRKIKQHDLDTTLQFVDKLILNRPIEEALGYLENLYVYQQHHHVDIEKNILLLKKRGDLYLALSKNSKRKQACINLAYQQYETAGKLGDNDSILKMIEYRKTTPKFNDKSPTYQYRKWLERGCEKNIPAALTGLAVLHLNDNKPKKATPLLEKAESEDLQAKFLLACCYRDGEGVPQNLTLARQKLQEASEKGHEQAKKYLKKEDLGAEDDKTD